MSDDSIIIIGAGIAGLTAGCYGQMNGYRTRIFESHNKPGGLCTAWKRSSETAANAKLGKSRASRRSGESR